MKNPTLEYMVLDTLDIMEIDQNSEESTLPFGALIVDLVDAVKMHNLLMCENVLITRAMFKAVANGFIEMRRGSTDNLDTTLVSLTDLGCARLEFLSHEK